jgi:hypothetical protein
LDFKKKPFFLYQLFNKKDFKRFFYKNDLKLSFRVKLFLFKTLFKFFLFKRVFKQNIRLSKNYSYKFKNFYSRSLRRKKYLFALKYNRRAFHKTKRYKSKGKFFHDKSKNRKIFSKRRGVYAKFSSLTYKKKFNKKRIIYNNFKRKVFKYKRLLRKNFIKEKKHSNEFGNKKIFYGRKDFYNKCKNRKIFKRSKRFFNKISKIKLSKKFKFFRKSKVFMRRRKKRFFSYGLRLQFFFRLLELLDKEQNKQKSQGNYDSDSDDNVQEDFVKYKFSKMNKVFDFKNENLLKEKGFKFFTSKDRNVNFKRLSEKKA